VNTQQLIHKDYRKKHVHDAAKNAANATKICMTAIMFSILFCSLFGITSFCSVEELNVRLTIPYNFKVTSCPVRSKIQGWHLQPKIIDNGRNSELALITTSVSLIYMCVYLSVDSTP
jgi:hypothetical protein